MKKAASISILVFALAVRTVAQQPVHRTMTTAQVFGFHGPIHTQKRSIQMLEKDPRSEPKLLVFTPAREWEAFSSTGEIVEEGDFNSDGQFVNRVTRTYDQDGETAETIAGDKKTRYRTKKATSEDGSAQTETYIDDVLRARITEVSDARTNSREVVASNENGEIVSRTLSREGKLVHDLQMWGRGGKLMIHTLRRLDEQGRTIQSDHFDESGKLVFNNVVQ